MVVPDDAPAEVFDPVRTWRIGHEARVLADIIPCTKSEFEDERDAVDSLPRAAVTRGVQIFGA